MKIKVR